MNPAVPLILQAVSFLLGACIGSFLNVVVWRVPRGESLVSPPSHCPKCNAPIRWWQNVPIVSWLALRGRCARCRAPISPRYIFVEFLTGLLFLAAFWRYGSFAPLAWVWISLMVAGSFIDFDHQLLPDFTTVGGMVYGVVCPAAFASIAWFTGADLREGTCGSEAWPVISEYPFAPSLPQSLAGLALGFGLLWLVRWLGGKAFKREAMGMGDVFLMGAVGALFGPVCVVVTLILSSVAGSVVGLAMVLLSKARLGGFKEIPYGPYICIGCIAWMFRGPELVAWYLRLFAPGSALA
ncbi:MAG: prepilin peptidase [Kiritimatiellae bacterium]|nr:prepilin peptidase [Kiritimatiellia bacterium]